MNEEIKKTEFEITEHVPMTEEEIQEAVDECIREASKNWVKEPQQPEQFRFFKNCSATLKKLSVAVFAINLFLIAVITVLGVVIAGMYMGFQVVAILAVPIISVIAILVIFARLASALIYGFAEIVEKHE